MKITKKAVVLLLILIFPAMAMYANGGKESGGKDTAAEINYTRWAGTQEARDFTKLATTFMEQHPNIKVNSEFLPWTAYWEKVRTSVISGDSADVLSMSIEQSAPYVSKKVLYDVTDLPGAKELISQMQPGTISSVKYEDRYYGIPVGIGQMAMIYNKDLLDKAGIAYPSTTKPMSWDEFKALSKKLTIKKGEEYLQYTAFFPNQRIYEAFIVQWGGALMDDYAAPTKMLINSPEAIAGLEYMMTLFGTVEPVYTGEWNNIFGTPDTAVGTGMVAFMHSGPWALSALDDAGVNYGTCPLPYNPKTGIRANRGYINFMAISRDTKKVEPSWVFVSWICGEGQLEFTKTGDLPANKLALEESKAVQTRPKEIMEAYYAELPYVFTGPLIPTDEFNSVIDVNTSDLFLGLIGVEEFVEKVEQEGNDVITRTY
ncbi:MAG: sugar ABC transporter substrate-binding protein [Spirochaetales bacterium]|nr:sugar ABC transporter substrate-binding protein [Spirochaetales bacterium]